MHWLVRPRPTSLRRGARNDRDPHQPSQHGELNHARAPPATISCYEYPACKPSRFELRQRAAERPASPSRPASLQELNSRRVGGRVHAHVRLRLALAYLPPPGSWVTTCNPRHASATGSLRGRAVNCGRCRCDQTAAPPASDAHSRSINFRSQQQSNARHHPPAQEIEDESRAVAGRVHAVVRCRCHFNFLVFVTK